MKKFFTILLLFPLMLTAQKKFSVSGNLPGLPDGSGVSLSNANSPTDTLAKGIVKNGAFELKGSVDEPNLYQLNLDGVQKKSILFIGNENVTVSGNIETVQDLQVQGSAVHNEFEQFKKTFNPLFQQLTEMGQRIQRLPSLAQDDSTMNAYRQHLGTIKKEVDNFVAKYPNSPVSPFVVVVTSEIEQDLSVIEKRYASLGKNAQGGFYGKIIRQQIDDKKAGAIGSQAIDFTQNDTEGKPVSLSSFRGKYVLVDFWASWCRPCREENPNVVKAYNKFKDKNFTVLGVSLDNNKQPWLKAIKNDQLSWTQVSDLKGWNNEAAARYKIESIPQNILLDPSGKIIAKNLRGPELQSRLCELLGCN